MELVKAQLQQELEAPMRERFRTLDEVSNEGEELRSSPCLHGKHPLHAVPTVDSEA